MGINLRDASRLLSLTALFGQPAYAAPTGSGPACASLFYNFANTISLSPTAYASVDNPVATAFKILLPNDPARGSLPVTVDAHTIFQMALGTSLPSTYASSTARALTITTPGVAKAADVSDKVVFSPLPHGSPYAVKVDGPPALHQFSFDFEIPTTYEVPTWWVIHMQAFECCTQRNPPLTLDVDSGTNPAGPVMFAVHVRDDKVQAEASPAPIEVGHFPVTRGVWHHVDFLLDPSPDSSSTTGLVVMELDGAVTAYYLGHWGYTLPTDRSPTIGFDLGIYRRRSDTSQSISFGNIYYRDVGCPVAPSP